MHVWRLLVALATISALCQVNRAQSDASDTFPAAGISTDPVEIVFSFDTTGSMYPVIDQVRHVVAGMIHRLQSDIPGIRMAVFAHGDYTDAYVTKHVDFTTDSHKLQRFVNNVGRTGGGDSPEAYEMVLREAWSELSWTVGSQRSLVMIGDERPHEADYRKNRLQIDWRTEAEQLNAMGVRIYAIQALHSSRAEQFYETIANITGGYHLRLENFDSIFDFILAISYREFGLIFLEAYEEEVRSRAGGITPELAKLFETLKKPREKNTEQITPTRAVKVVETTEAPTTLAPVRVNKDMDIYFLHINSSISYRYATTTVTSKLANRHSDASEASFNIQLPKAAFISNFSMEIEGEIYPGEVKEKEKAKKQYDAAVAKGESAGHVVAAPRNTNSFKVSVNVAASSKVTFTLIYEELLERRLGFYEHIIHVDPGQVVNNLKIDVYIAESRDITMLRVPPLRNDLMNSLIPEESDTSIATITRSGGNQAHVSYAPDDVEQEEMSDLGIRGQFVVQYDVERDRDAGEVEVVDGYFVHYFAPEGLIPADKNIMFVLDVSGSMSGTKLSQLKDAMSTILEQLRPGDYFNVLGFSTFFWHWQTDGMAPATADNIENAKTWVQNLFAAGGTNINKAILKGMALMDDHYANSTVMPGASLVIFLTDGQATSGETDLSVILENIKSYNNERFTLFSLGFGNEVDFPFLQKLSLQNKGFARRIYADSDAALQLQGFYNEVASPVMSNITVKYIGDVNETSLTTTTYHTFFDGTEIIITGVYDITTPNDLQAQITGNTVEGPMTFDLIMQTKDAAPPVGNLKNNIQRMWAYLTINEVLTKMKTTTDKNEKELLKQKALALSLKYHFVTPLTSMVVTKPEESNDVGDLEDPDQVKPTVPSQLPGGKRSGGRFDDEGPRGASYDSIREHSKLSHVPTAPKRRGGGGGGGRSWADSDPHFIVTVRGSDVPVCFDVMGQPGDSFRLLQDVKRDITVNGLLVTEKKRNITKTKPHIKTYFGKIAVFHAATTLVVTPVNYTLDGTVYRKWRENITHHSGNVVLRLRRGPKMTMHIEIGENIEFMILRHKVKKNHPHKVDFLGFYVERKHGLSKAVHGLIGQFQHLMIHVDKNISAVCEKKCAAKMSFPEDPARNATLVYHGHRENLATKQIVPCWSVRNNGRGFLEGHLNHYKVSSLKNRKLKRYKRQDYL